jgi:hypothetical protein
MPALKLRNFGGMIPALDSRLLPDNQAELSENTWVYTGALQGFRKPVPIHNCASDLIRKVYRIPIQYYDKAHIPDSYWLEFENPDTDVVRSPTVGDQYDRYYWASSQSFSQIKPQYNTRARIAAGSPSYTLGIPAPTVAPTIGTVTGSDPKEDRSYVYTWVSAFGEEGPPSPPSAVTHGHSVGTWPITLTAPTSADTTNRNLATVNIYRTVTGSSGAASFFFVASVPVGTTLYNDSILSTVVTANKILESTYWTAPPTDLEGMVTMPNGIIAGWRQNEIWFCEPYRPHAWPVAYTNAVEFPVVGCGVIGQTLIVCTTGSPYAISGVNPGTMTVSRVAAFEPCLSRGSILSTPIGVAYASSNGLALAVPGAVSVISRSMITKDIWQDLLNLETLRAAPLNGGYYCWGSVRPGCFEETAFETPAFLQDDYTGSYTGAFIDASNQRVSFNRLTDVDPTFNVTTDHWTGEVFVIREGVVYWVDVSETREHGDYIWKSKVFEMPNRRNLEAMRVWFDTFSDTPALNPVPVVSPTTLQPDMYGIVRVYADGVLRLSREIRTTGEFIRLPSGFKAQYWQVEIEGRVQINEIEVATTAKELTSV